MSATPKGWRLVPIEPTPEMLLAGSRNANDTRNKARRLYAAMLAAAPRAPASLPASDTITLDAIETPESDALSFTEVCRG